MKTLPNALFNKKKYAKSPENMKISFKRGGFTNIEKHLWREI